ncbi:hypothetical protein AB0C43_31920, partial [Streptomyces sp. NPDC048669]
TPTLSLSQADCLALEPQVSEWLERGATEPELLHALTDGLPTPVHHAAALVRRRLHDKLPPVRVASPAHRIVLRTLECGECRAPGNAEAMPGGLCGTCRGNPNPAPTAPTGPADAVPVQGVRARMSAVRAGLVPRAERAQR